MYYVSVSCWRLCIILEVACLHSETNKTLDGLTNIKWKEFSLDLLGDLVVFDLNKNYV
jgi:hypothetical protein